MEKRYTTLITHTQNIFYEILRACNTYHRNIAQTMINCSMFGTDVFKRLSEEKLNDYDNTNINKYCWNKTSVEKLFDIYKKYGRASVCKDRRSKKPAKEFAKIADKHNLLQIRTIKEFVDEIKKINKNNQLEENKYLFDVSDNSSVFSQSPLPGIINSAVVCLDMLLKIIEYNKTKLQNTLVTHDNLEEYTEYKKLIEDPGTPILEITYLTLPFGLFAFYEQIDNIFSTATNHSFFMVNFIFTDPQKTNSLITTDNERSSACRKLLHEALGQFEGYIHSCVLKFKPSENTDKQYDGCREMTIDFIRKLFDSIDKLLEDVVMQFLADPSVPKLIKTALSTRIPIKSKLIFYFQELSDEDTENKFVFYAHKASTEVLFLLNKIFCILSYDYKNDGYPIGVYDFK